MEISEDGGEGTEEKKNSETDVCSEFGEHEVFDNYKPDLKETLVLEEQGDQNFIVDDSYNKFEVEKDDY